MRTRFNPYRTIKTIAVLAACLAAFFLLPGRAHAQSPIKVHMINVGKADSFLIECDGHYALIDGGWMSNVNKYKDNKAISGLCRLDKTASITDALNGKVANLTSFYSNNLISFFEHFDNDMKTLTGQKGSAVIIAAADQYIADFDEAVQDYKDKKEAEPPQEDTILPDAEWAAYERDQKAIEDVRSRIDGAYACEPSVMRAFMELQKTNAYIKAESRNSLLYKYYTALGYQYIFSQAKGYMQTTAYARGGYSECLAYINKLGIKQIDYMILTHSHRDHVGGLAAILADDSITVDNIIYNGSSYGTGNYRIFEHEMLDRAVGCNIIKADDDKNNMFTLGGKVVFTQLGDTDRLPSYTREPDESSSSDTERMTDIVNNQSLVYRMDYDGASMLFTGDALAQKDANGYNHQAAILKKFRAKLNVDILKAAHHCHRNGSSESFNAVVSPKFVFASCGKSKEPNAIARKALDKADMWLSKFKGDALVASISGNTFRVVNGSGKDLTNSPDYAHKKGYTVKSSFGTPRVDKASFAAGGRKVDYLRTVGTKIGYYNPPSAKPIKLTVTRGWYHDKVEYQLCPNDAGRSAKNWQAGSTLSIPVGFKGTVHLRFTNRFGVQTIERKTDGFEVRAAGSKIRKGKAHLYKYNAARIDWYPAAGAKQYQVWYKKGDKWKSKGKTSRLYLNVSGLPKGKKVKFRIKAAGKKGYAYLTVRTLKKAGTPKVWKKRGKAKVSWKKIAGSSGYQVAVNSRVKKTVTGSRSALLKVSKGRTLSYKVRAFAYSNGSYVYGPWSGKRKFRLK